MCMQAPLEPFVYFIDLSIVNDNVGDQTIGAQFTLPEASEILDFAVQATDATPNAIDVTKLTSGGIAYRPYVTDTPAQNNFLRLTLANISEQTANTPDVVGAPAIPDLVPAGTIIRFRHLNQDTGTTFRIIFAVKTYGRIPSYTLIGADANDTVNSGNTHE